MGLRGFSFFLVCISLFVFLSCQSAPLVDGAMSAKDGHESSVILCGLGEKCRKGMLFVQSQAGNSTSGKIEVIIPPVHCERDECALIQLWKKDGSLGFSSGVKKGQTKIVFSLKEVLDSEFLFPYHDGEYLLKVKLIYIDANGLERSTISHGFIRVNVLDERYQQAGCDDPALAWVVEPSKNCAAGFTTAFRTSLCGKGCE